MNDLSGFLAPENIQ